jgi:hypothetical protein
MAHFSSRPSQISRVCVDQTKEHRKSRVKNHNVIFDAAFLLRVVKNAPRLRFLKIAVSEQGYFEHHWLR